jgi:hypothetical protein
VLLYKVVMPDFAGFEMKYASKSNGQSYVMPLDIPSRHGIANRWDAGRVILAGLNGDFTQLDDDVVGVSQNDNVRIYVTTSDGYATSAIQTDRAKLLISKFMQTKNDWKNVEITFVFTYRGGGSNSSVTIGARGGLQENPCEGFAYKAIFDLDADGGAFSKQQYFPAGNDKRFFTTSKFGASIRDKKVALKFCLFNDGSNVKLELYGALIGTFGFKKLASEIDNGGWGDTPVLCGGDGGMIGIWGGPLIFVQWGDGAVIEISSLTVREIDIGKSFSTVPTSQTILPTVTTTPQPVVQSTVSNETKLDDYGVLKIYQSKQDGTNFYPPQKGMTSDDRFDANGASIKNNNDGTYKVTGKSRMLVYSTKTAADRGEGFTFSTYDFDELRKRGAWDDKKTDYRDTETTYYVKCDSTSGSADELSLVARSVRHEETDHNGCGGSSYHGSLRFTDGAARLIKEPRHVDYTDYKTSSKKLGNILGKWIGFKFVVFNETDTSVRMAVYLDPKNDNTWNNGEPYIEYLDTGNWSEGSSEGMTPCGGTSKGMAITWGSIKQVIKDNGLSITLKKFSVRSITKKKISDQVPSSGGGDTPPTGSTGQVSRVFSRFIFFYNIIVNTDLESPCSGFTGSPPATAYNEISGLTVTDITEDKQLSGNYSSEDDRKRVGWYVNSTDSRLKGKKPVRVKVYLKKKGSPTGDLMVYLLDNNNNIKRQYGNTLDVTTLTTSYVLTTFTDDDAGDSMPNGMQKDWKIAVEYSGGDKDNHVLVGINDNDQVDGDKTIEYQREKEPGPDYSDVKHTDREMCGFLYTS